MCIVLPHTQNTSVYRRSGDTAQVNKLLAKFGDEGRNPVFLDVSCHTLAVRYVMPGGSGDAEHTTSCSLPCFVRSPSPCFSSLFFFPQSLVKWFFIRLPEPLLTYDLFHNFVEAAEASDPDGVVMWDLVNQLPERHVAVLRRLMAHLRRMSGREVRSFFFFLFFHIDFCCWFRSLFSLVSCLTCAMPCAVVCCRVCVVQEINKLSRAGIATSFGAVVVRHRDAGVIRANMKRLGAVVSKLMRLNWVKGSGVL